MAKTKATKKRRNFSSFTLAEAFKQLGVQQLLDWPLTAEPVTPSPFFHEQMQRLKQFDLHGSESAKALLIDAVYEEVIPQHAQLKIWKEAPLTSDQLGGVVDYLIAPNRRYLEAPLLCVTEAKKDDFEQGLTQCLVAMQACQWNNAQLGKQLDIFGVVTNGDTWRFYKLTTEGQVLESLPHALGELEKLLGLLHVILSACEAQLK
jgi:hypothetical protein